MSTSVAERIEKNKVKLTFEVDASTLSKGLEFAYHKNKHHIAIDGFRKGKAPRKMIERLYGKDVFHDDAINHVLPEAYEKAIEEAGLEPVYRPDINVEAVDEKTGAKFVAEVYVKPEVVVDGYHGLTYPKPNTDPTEDEIHNRLRAEQEKNARTLTVERPAENGDIVTIHFAGFIDGEPFEGGTAENYELTLGSHSFIDTFEDQLVGHQAGDDVDVHVTFPEAYHAESLKGKPALFKVEILEVQAKELPEINDEFAQDVSEFETLAEYRQSIIDAIRKMKEEQAESDKRAHILRQLVEKAEMEVPEVMYTARMEEMYEDLNFRLGQQGLTMELYLRMNRTTEAGLRESFRIPAKENVDASLVLEAVAKKEEMDISDDMFRAEIEKIFGGGNEEEQNTAEIDRFMERLQPKRKTDMVGDMLNQQALDFVIEKAVAVEGTLAEL
jgi:trigger factor